MIMLRETFHESEYTREELEFAVKDIRGACRAMKDFRRSQPLSVEESCAYFRAIMLFERAANIILVEAHKAQDADND